MARGSGNPFEDGLDPLPDYTEVRARLALDILVRVHGIQHTPFEEEDLHEALLQADAILLGSLSITLQAQQEARDAQIKQMNEVLGIPSITPNQSEPL